MFDSEKGGSMEGAFTMTPESDEPLSNAQRPSFDVRINTWHMGLQQILF
jgi:hypothetical protein